MDMKQNYTKINLDEWNRGKLFKSYIDNMRIVDRRIIGRGETEVIGQQPIVRTGVDTAGGRIDTGTA